MSRLGRLESAIESLAAARDAAPDDPLRTYFLGRATLMRDPATAASHFERCLDVEPACAGGAGLAALRLGDPTRAAEVTSTAVGTEGRSIRARALLAVGEWGAAGALIADEPHPVALVTLARQRLRAGGEAWGPLARAVASAPDDAEPWSTRAIAWRLAGDLEAATADLEAALSRAPERADLRWDLALSLQSSGRAGAAVAHLDRLVARFPDDPRYLVALGAALLGSGEPTRALELVTRRLTASPDDPDALLLQARALVAAGRTDEALALRPRLYGGDSAPRARLVLASALEVAGHGTQAESELADAVARHPDDVEAWIAYADFAVRGQRPQRGASLLLAAVERHPASAPLLAALARLRAASGDPTQARRLYLEAAGLDPDDPDRADEAARLRLETGDGEGAIAEWRTLLSAHPRADRARMRLAGALYHARRSREAVTELRRLRATRPTDAKVTVLFAKALVDAGEPSEAAASLASMDTPALQGIRAAALAAAGRGAEAEAAFRAALAADPTQRPLRLALARLVAAEGRAEEAIELITRQLDRDPHDQRALGLLMEVAGPGRASLVLADLPGARAAQADPTLAALAEEAGEVRDDATVLRDERYVTVDRGGVATVRHVRSVVLRTAVGVERHRRVPIAFHAHAAPTVLRARTLTPDGVILDVPAALRTVHDPNERGGLRSEARALVLEFPQVEPGAVVDYEVLVHRPHPGLSGLWWDGYVLGNAEPTVRARYEITLPAGAPVRFASPGLPPPTEARHDGRRVLRWRRDGLPGYATAKVPVPAVYVSGMEDWADVDAWYASLYFERARATDALAARARRLVAGLSGRRARIGALLRFVEQSTRYLGIEFGLGAYQPRPPESTVAVGAGDCKDMTALLQALLAGVGIEALPAMVRPRSRAGFVPTLPSPAQFSHVVLYVPSEELWLDATAGLGTVGAVPAPLRGQPALVVDGRGGELTRIPEPDLAQHGRRERVVWRIGTTGAGQVEVETELRGDPAGEARARLLEVAPEAQQALLGAPGVLLGRDRVPDTLSVAGLDDPTAPLVLRAETSEPTLVRVRLDGRMELSPGATLLDLRPLSWSGDERPPEAPQRIERRLRIELPDGYEPTWAPLRFDETGGAVTLRLEEAREGSAVTFTLRTDILRRGLDDASRHRFTAAREHVEGLLSQTLAAHPGPDFDTVSFLRAVAERDPGDARVHALLGQALDDRGDLAGARAALQRALRTDPAYAAARGVLAGVLLKLERSDEAEATLDEALARADHPPEAHLWRAALMRATARGAEATAELRRGLAHHPEEAVLGTALADALREEGDAAVDGEALAAAEAAYRGVLELTPNDASVLNNLAWILRDSPDHLAEALELVERSLALNPRSEAAWDTLAELHFRNGEPRSAIEAIDRAAAQEPSKKAFYDERRRKYRRACGDCPP